jgi:hypothetical protein
MSWTSWLAGEPFALPSGKAGVFDGKPVFMTSIDQNWFLRESGLAISVKAFLRDVEADCCRFVPSGMMKRRFEEAFHRDVETDCCRFVPSGMMKRRFGEAFHLAGGSGADRMSCFRILQRMWARESDCFG